MKINNPILKVSLRFGLVASAFSIILFSILYFAGRNPLMIPAYFDFRLLLFPIFLVFGIRDFREYRNNGILHFWQGFSVGGLIIIIIGISMLIYIFILGGLLDQHFTSNYISATIRHISEAKESIIAQVGEKAYTKSLEILPTTTLTDLAFDYFIKSIPLGIMLTILITLVLRNNAR